MSGEQWMERLTKSGTDYCAEYCCEEHCVSSAHCRLFKHELQTLCQDAVIYNRLAAYEDTGIEPEEASALQMHPDHAYADYVRALWHDIGGMERMEELVKAEREGRLLVLPCKVGTPVYRLEYNQHDGSWIELREFDFRDVNVFGETVV